MGKDPAIMGSGASSGLTAVLQQSTTEEVTEALSTLSEVDRQRIAKALGIETQPTASTHYGTTGNGEVLCVAMFDVDASVEDVVNYLSTPAGWIKIVPGFEEGCEVVMLDESSGFRATTQKNNWMWVTDIASVPSSAGC